MHEDFVPILLNRLEVRPGLTIADIGCGTGFFTRLFARGLKGEGQVIGIDRDEWFVRVAKSLARNERLSGTVSFRNGNAESIPLADGTADRVVCQTLLWYTKNPLQIIREMARVCKPGGIVGAVEGAFDRVIWYFPDDPRLTALYQKWVVAFAKGHAKLNGRDRGIAYKLPAMFSEAGLKRIRLDGFPSVWLESDDRVPGGFRMQRHRIEVHDYEHPEMESRKERARILKLGGMTGSEVAEMRRRSYERSKRILHNPKLLGGDFSMKRPSLPSDDGNQVTMKNAKNDWR